MSQGKKVDTSSLPSVEEAFRDHNWAEVRFRLGLHLANAVGNTDSARDKKAIAMSLMPLVDKIEADEQRENGSKGTPHDDIVRRAREAREKAMAASG